MKLHRYIHIAALCLLMQALHAQPGFYEFLKNNRDSVENFSDTNFYKVRALLEKYWEANDSLKTVKGSGYKDYVRWANFMIDKVDSNGSIGPYLRAREAYFREVGRGTYTGNAMKSGKTAAKGRDQILVEEEDMNWYYLGPVGIPKGDRDGSQNNAGKGWINTLHVWPNDHDTIWAGSHDGGLWKTTDKGNSWTCISDDLQHGGIVTFLVDPTNQNKIYVGTAVKMGGTYEYSYGVYKTTDGGSTWAAINTGALSGLYPTLGVGNLPVKLIFDPGDNNAIFLVTNNGIYEYSISGNTWTQRKYDSWDYYSGQSGYSDIEFDPGDANTVYASGYKIFKSTDGGQTWPNDITSSVDIDGDATMLRCVMAVNSQYSGKVWFYYADIDGGTPVRKYASGSYSTIASNINTTSLYGKMDIEVSALNENIIYVGGIALKKYDSGTSSETTIANAYDETQSSDWVHADIRDIFYTVENLGGGDEDVLYVAYDGGVSWGEDDGDADAYYYWTNISDDGSGGLHTNEFYRIAGTEQDENVLIGGLQDHSMLLYNTAWQDDWQEYSVGDGGEAAIDPTDKNLIYHLIPNGANLYRTANLGANASLIFSYSIPSAAYMRDPLMLNPKDRTTMILGANKNGGSILYRLSDVHTASYPAGSEDISPTSGEGFTSTHGISAAAYALSDTSRLYMAAGPASVDWVFHAINNQFFRSSDAGSTWVDVSDYLDNNTGDTLIGYADGYVTDIAVNPYDKDELWVCFGQLGEGAYKVAHTNNGGESWANIGMSNLDHVPHHSIKYDHINKELYLGSSVGVFYRDILDNSWTDVTGCMPANLMATDLELNISHDKVRIGTYGRGIWQANLKFCPVSASLTLTGALTTDTKKEAETTISSSQTLNSGIDVRYHAGTSITLTEGFYASNSTEFSARIRPLSCESCLGFSHHDGGDEKDVIADQESGLLLAAFPNPFSNNTEIAYSVPVEGVVSLEITDLTGRLVLSCVNAVKSYGAYSYDLSGRTLNPGAYLCILRSGSDTRIIKLIAQ